MGRMDQEAKAPDRFFRPRSRGPAGLKGDQVKINPGAGKVRAVGPYSPAMSLDAQQKRLRQQTLRLGDGGSYEKWCPACEDWWPFDTEFWPVNNGTIDRLKWRCKACDQNNVTRPEVSANPLREAL